MCGIKKEKVGQAKKMCKEKNNQQPMFLHCLIPQQTRCIKIANISRVPSPVIFIGPIIDILRDTVEDIDIK
jgi:hypothetical protein